MQKIESLCLSDNNISDISPLKNLYNLKYLELSYNNISDISTIVNLYNLKSLELSHNNICDISPISNLTKLHSLNIRSNIINDLTSLAGLRKLKNLYTRYNPIKSIFPLTDNKTRIHYSELIRKIKLDIGFTAKQYNIINECIENPTKDFTLKAIKETPIIYIVAKGIFADVEWQSIFRELLGSPKIHKQYVRHFIRFSILDDKSEAFILKYGSTKAKAALMELKLQKHL